MADNDQSQSAALPVPDVDKDLRKDVSATQNNYLPVPDIDKDLRKDIAITPKQEITKSATESVSKIPEVTADIASSSAETQGLSKYSLQDVKNLGRLPYVGENIPTTQPAAQPGTLQVPDLEKDLRKPDTKSDMVNEAIKELDKVGPYNTDPTKVKKIISSLDDTQKKQLISRGYQWTYPLMSPKEQDTQYLLHRQEAPFSAKDAEDLTGAAATGLFNSIIGGANFGMHEINALMSGRATIVNDANGNPIYRSDNDKKMIEQAQADERNMLGAIAKGGTEAWRMGKKFIGQSDFQKNKEVADIVAGGRGANPILSLVTQIALLAKEPKSGSLAALDHINRMVSGDTQLERQHWHQRMTSEAEDSAKDWRARQGEQQISPWSQWMYSPFGQDIMVQRERSLLPSASVYGAIHGMTDEQANVALDNIAHRNADTSSHELAVKWNKEHDQAMEDFGALALGPVAQGPAGFALGAIGLAKKAAGAAELIGMSDEAVNAYLTAKQARLALAAEKKTQQAAKPSFVGTTGKTVEQAQQNLAEKGKALWDSVPEKWKPVTKSALQLTGLATGGGVVGEMLNPEAPKEGILGGLALTATLAHVPGMLRSIDEARQAIAAGEGGLLETAGMRPESSAATKFFLGGKRGENADYLVKNIAPAVKAGVDLGLLNLVTSTLNSDDPKGYYQSVLSGIENGIGFHVMGGAFKGLHETPMSESIDDRAKRDIEIYHAVNSASDATKANIANISDFSHAVDRAKMFTLTMQAKLSDAMDSGDQEKITAAQQALKIAQAIQKDVLRANVQTRNEYGRNFRSTYADIHALANGSRSGQGRIKMEVLTTQQIFEKLKQENINNNLGRSDIDMKMEARRPGRFNKDNGEFIVNADNIRRRQTLFGESPTQALRHEGGGHGLSNIPEFRKLNEQAEKLMFDHQERDLSGNILAETKGQFSDDDLVKSYFDEYLKGDSMDQKIQFARDNGLWDEKNNTIDRQKVVDYMKEEYIAELNAGNLRQGLGKLKKNNSAIDDWLTQRRDSNMLTASLRSLTGMGAKPIHSELLGATFSPEIVAANRAALAALAKQNGRFADATEATKGHDLPEKVLRTDPVMRRRYSLNGGEFKTQFVAEIRDKNGRLVGRPVPLPENAAEGTWTHDETTNTIKKVDGYGQLHESAGMGVPLGGTVTVKRDFIYEPDGKTPIRNDDKTINKLSDDRAEAIRKALETDDRYSGVGLIPVSADGESLSGIMSPKQIQAIKDIPENILPLSIKKKIFEFNDAMARNDGSTYDIDYAPRLQGKKYKGRRSEIYGIAPIGWGLSKVGNFYNRSISLGALYRKVKTRKRLMPGWYAAWGGSTEDFMDEFRNTYLKNTHENKPGWMGLDPEHPTEKTDLAVMKQRKFNDMMNLANRPFETTPKDPLKRGSKPGDVDTLWRSFRLDAIADMAHTPERDYKMNAGRVYENLMPREVQELPQLSKDDRNKALEFINANKLSPENILNGLRTMHNADVMALTERLPGHTLGEIAKHIAGASGGSRVANISTIRREVNRLKNPSTVFMPREVQEMDDAHAKAIESGDTKEAQRLVDEAAKKAGYGIPPSPKLSENQIEDLLQTIDGARPRDKQATKVLGQYAKQLKQKGVSSLDAYHLTSYDPIKIQENGLKAFQTGNAGGDANLRPESIYIFLEPDEIPKAQEGVMGSNNEKDVIVHIEIPIEEIKKMYWDGNFNISYEVRSGIRYEGNIPEKWIAGIYKFDTLSAKSKQGKLYYPAATYDKDGNLIPLSQRFNPKSNDIRFMPADEEYTNEQKTRNDLVRKYDDLIKSQSSKGSSVVYHQPPEKDADGDVINNALWVVSSPKNERESIITKNDDGLFDVSKGEDGMFYDHETLEDAMRQARHYVESAPSSDQHNLQRDARSEIMEEIHIPSDMVLKEVRDTANDSIYYRVDHILSRDEEGDPDDVETYKISIRNHDPSPFRELEFGKNDYWVEVPKNPSPKDMADAVSKVEKWLENQSNINFMPREVQEPSEEPAKNLNDAIERAKAAIKPENMPVAKFNFTASTDYVPEIKALIDNKDWKGLQELNRSIVTHAFADMKDLDFEIRHVRGVFEGGKEISSEVIVRPKNDEELQKARARMIDIAAQTKQIELLETKMGAGREDMLGGTDDDGFQHTEVVSIPYTKATDSQLEKARKKADIGALSVGKNEIEIYNTDDEREAFRDKINKFKEALKNAGINVGTSELGVAAIRSYRDPEKLKPGSFAYTDPQIRVQAGDKPIGGVKNTIYSRITRLLGRPIAAVKEGARSYFEPSDITPKQVQKQTEIADVYDRMLPTNDYKNPLVKKAYDRLNEELLKQYDALTEDREGDPGMKFHVRTSEDLDKIYPPGESAPVIQDIRNNNRLYVLKTEPESFGPKDPKTGKPFDFSFHPLLKDSGRVDADGNPMTYNDVLRAVHDAVAHGLFANTFGAAGEEGAWNTHLRTIDDPYARWALTTETRGQNSFFNYGRKTLDETGEPYKQGDAGYHETWERFADQKAALMPLRYVLTGDKKVDAPVLELMDELGKEKSEGSARLPYDEKVGAFVFDPGDSKTTPVYVEAVQATKTKKLKGGGTEEVPVFDKRGKPVMVPAMSKGKLKIKIEDYKLLSAPNILNYSGAGPEDTTKPDYAGFAYDVTPTGQKAINRAIDSGAVDAAANSIVNKVNVVMQNPEIAAGKGWYSRMRENLLNALGSEGREMLSQLLGATSARTPVNENFLQAMDALEGWLSGRYEKNRKQYLEYKAAEENGTIHDLIRDRGYLDTIKQKADRFSAEAENYTGKKQEALLKQAKILNDLVTTPVEKQSKSWRYKVTAAATDMVPLRSNGKKFNANSNSVLKVLGGTWLDNRKAPKTPNFAGNLSGRTVQATIDVWAARFLRQLLYEGSGKPFRIQPRSETGVNNDDFALGQIVMDRAAKKLGMNPDDLQAILWFAEKHNWEEQGWTRSVGAEKSSFDDIFHVFFPEGKKPLSYAEASEKFKEMKETPQDEYEDEDEEDTE